MAFAFGAQPTQTQPAPFGGFSFNNASTTTTQSLSATPFSSISNPGTQIGFGTAPATTTSSIFGGSTSFTPASTTSFFATPSQAATTTAIPGFSFGGFGTTQSFGTTPLSGATVVSSAAPIGLGGVDVQLSNGIDAATGIIKRDKAVKEALIPNELAIVVEAFKKHVKEQKNIKEEMCRISNKNIGAVQTQVVNLKNQLSIVSNSFQRHLATSTRLKDETSEEIKNIEIAQRTKDTPPSLQFENTAPSTYFHNLSISFENQMLSYREQIELLEKHLMSLGQPSPMTADELTVVVKKLHDAFVTLAAQLQTVHQQVQLQKEQFRTIQKAASPEFGDLFDMRKKTSVNLDRKIYQPIPATTPVTSGSSSVIAMPTTGGFGMTSGKTRGEMSGSIFNIQQPSGISFQNTTSSPFKPLDKPLGK